MWTPDKDEDNLTTESMESTEILLFFSVYPAISVVIFFQGEIRR